MAARLVLWDFDGTLARRTGLWSGCMLEVLDEAEPGHGLTRADVREAMRGRYLWNRPGEPHPHLCEPDGWWEEMERRMGRALALAGIAEDRAARHAGAVRERFLDPAIAWSIYADALPALRRVRAAGMRSAILSNHVPELPTLVRELCLGAEVEAVFTSAASGFEKPHPLAFALALQELGCEPHRAWMVGDNPVADLEGARAAGMAAVLVRAGEPAAGRGDGGLRAAGLLEASELILAG